MAERHGPSVQLTANDAYSGAEGSGEYLRSVLRGSADELAPTTDRLVSEARYLPHGSIKFMRIRRHIESPGEVLSGLTSADAVSRRWVSMHVSALHVRKRS